MPVETDGSRILPPAKTRHRATQEPFRNAVAVQTLPLKADSSLQPQYPTEFPIPPSENCRGICLPYGAVEGRDHQRFSVGEEEPQLGQRRHQNQSAIFVASIRDPRSWQTLSISLGFSQCVSNKLAKCRSYRFVKVFSERAIKFSNRNQLNNLRKIFVHVANVFCATGDFDFDKSG